MAASPQVAPARRFERDIGAAHEPWHRSPRARLFGLVSGITLVIGVTWTLFQPAVYRSSATVLMSAPTAIDAEISQADVQGVAIQRQILLGSDITRRLAEELASAHSLNLDAARLQALLQVNPVPDTNLLEMAAQGPDGELLPQLINTWIDVYLALRANEIEQRKQHTLQVVQDELDGLAIKLVEARAALEQYRASNGIISAERQENAVLARLDGLNSALNSAIEEEVKASAYLDAVVQAISRGEPVVPKEESGLVENLSQELRELQARMMELTKLYTMEYIDKEPRLRAVPERIAELTAQLAIAYSQGRETELASARQAHAAASRAVADLQGKLDSHKQQVAHFNTVYATHQALIEDLANLEELNRNTQARLVQVEVRQVDKYPQVSVINRPGQQSVRLGPDYLLYLGASLGVAVALGVFSVWLHGFLSPRNEQPAYVTLSGVHLYPQEVAGELGSPGRPDPRLDAHAHALVQQEASDADRGDPDVERGDKSRT